MDDEKGNQNLDKIMALSEEELDEIFSQMSMMEIDELFTELNGGE